MSSSRFLLAKNGVVGDVFVSTHREAIVAYIMAWTR